MEFDYTYTLFLLMTNRQMIIAKINKNKTMRNMTLSGLNIRNGAKRIQALNFTADYLMVSKSYSLKSSLN